MIAVAAPMIAGAGLVMVAALVFTAGVVDARTRRIPNRLVLAILAVTATSAVALVATGNSTTSAAFTDIGLGIMLSGAPLLFLVWLARPAAIGGGDWKLLAAVGATLGLLISPFGALVAGFTAAIVHLASAAIRRVGLLPYAPSLSVGYVLGWGAAAWMGSQAGALT